MLTIRKEQFAEIGQRLANRWEDTMVFHLATFFPERSAELGERGVRDAIALGQKKAAKYDIFTERDVCKFLNFMFAFGFDFDTDPELPWAKAILTNPMYGRSNLKMHLLEQAADGTLQPEPEPFVPPTDEEIEKMRQERAAMEAAQAAEAARVLESERATEMARVSEMARQAGYSGDPSKMGDGDGTSS